jgi:hypothetical protein
MFKPWEIPPPDYSIPQDPRQRIVKKNMIFSFTGTIAEGA